MIRLGYKLMSEEHGPADLVRNAQRAEQAGFDFAAISDHFFPWLEEQGHAPFAWSVLGAVANATRRIGLMTAVTCPILRYHPAIVAQGAATVALLSGNRFTLGLGAGERLNEHIVGQGWPGLGERHERLAEAIDIIQGLLAGETRELPRQALPARPCAAVRPARRQARRGRGGRRSGSGSAGRAERRRADRHRAEERFHRGLPDGRRFGTALCRGGAVLRRAGGRGGRDGAPLFRWSLGGWAVMAELPDTGGFAAASQHLSPEMVAKEISCGPSADRHLEAIGRYIDAGFDHIILCQIGPDQDSFLELFQRALAPALRPRQAA